MATLRTDRLVVLDHPLVQHKLALLRDVETTTKDFRHLMGELAAFLCYEATRDLELEEYRVRTPLEETPARLALLPLAERRGSFHARSVHRRTHLTRVL